jgi:putative Ca2+/H+ antiporter (TMEM165/GDT1 family)
MRSLLLAAYVTVFAAEIVGDKLLYTTGVLGAQYPRAPLLWGMTLAFMVKMGVAVAIGNAISNLPPLLVASITSVSFLSVAFAVWRKDERLSRSSSGSRRSTAALISFGAILLSEWGDLGQITAATMAARFGSPLTIWLGAVGAMATKGVLAASFGAAVRAWIQERVQPRVVRYGSVAFLLALGVLSALEALSRMHREWP